MQCKRIKMALFDVDGVIVEANSSWQVIHEALGVADEADKGTRLFLEGVMDYLKWMEHDTGLWASRRRLHINELREMLSRVPIRGEAKDVARELHRRGVIVGLVSGGIDLLVSRVAREIGADVWVANRLSYDKEGYLVKGGMPLVPAERKDIVVRRILGEYGISREEALFVGDSPWDIPAFLVVGLPVGFGGDPRIEPYIKRRIHRLDELIGVIRDYENCIL